MMYLKQSYPVIIAGHPDAPDGIVDDWNTCDHRQALLVHHKEYGSCCNAVMKAL
jgi:hypothetical protein